MLTPLSLNRKKVTQFVDLFLHMIQPDQFLQLGELGFDVKHLLGLLPTAGRGSNPDR